MPSFGPVGDSAVITLTSSSQAFALGTLAAINPAIRLIALNASQQAWYVRFGTSGAVTVTDANGMRVIPADQNVPIILPVPTGATHVAIMAEGADGDAQISYGGFDDGEFAPAGDSQSIDVTQTTQTVALGTLGAAQPAIRLVSTVASISALLVKLGNGSVTGSDATSMKVPPGSVENPTIIPVMAGQTHIAIYSDGVGGAVKLTPGSVTLGATLATGIQMLASPRLLGRASGGAGPAEELTITQALDFVGGAAQGDVLYRSASAWDNLAAGTAGYVLRTGGAGANPAWAPGGLRYVTSGTVSNAATLDLTIPSDCDVMEIELVNWRPATDAAILFMRFSQSGSFLSGASDYSWGMVRDGVGIGDSADSEIEVSASWGNATSPLEYGVFQMQLFRPSATSFSKCALWNGFNAFTNSVIVGAQGSGRLMLNTNAIDGVRFLFSSGNIAEGFYVVRAYSNT